MNAKSMLPFSVYRSTQANTRCKTLPVLALGLVACLATNGLAAPVAMDDMTITPFETPTTIPVLANDFEDGAPIDPSSIEIVAYPSSGMLEIDYVNGFVTYFPYLGFEGGDTFEYRVRDTSNEVSNTTFAYIIVDPPTGTSDPPMEEGYPPSIDTYSATYDYEEGAWTIEGTVFAEDLSSVNVVFQGDYNRNFPVDPDGSYWAYIYADEMEEVHFTLHAEDTLTGETSEPIEDWLWAY